MPPLWALRWERCDESLASANLAPRAAREPGSPASFPPYGRGSVNQPPGFVSPLAFPAFRAYVDNTQRLLPLEQAMSRSRNQRTRRAAAKMRRKHREGARRSHKVNSHHQFNQG
ncbi:hypothetical protein GCM10010151_21860 [Actinoallomurus spadix]|uniref:Uncharacterized protein n=1 Tax=Actinoallomurus spadix TaxID=79912 RepID=A0ABP3G207_9ACTN